MKMSENKEIKIQSPILCSPILTPLIRCWFWGPSENLVTSFMQNRVSLIEKKAKTKMQIQKYLKGSPQPFLIHTCELDLIWKSNKKQSLHIARKRKRPANQAIDYKICKQITLFLKIQLCQIRENTKLKTYQYLTQVWFHHLYLKKVVKIIQKQYSCLLTLSAAKRRFMGEYLKARKLNIS